MMDNLYHMFLSDRFLRFVLVCGVIVVAVGGYQMWKFFQEWGRDRDDGGEV